MTAAAVLSADRIVKFAYDDNGRRTRGSNVKLLSSASIDLHPGEVHALVGANGAGKSTLIKTIAGAIPPDGGELRIDGEPVRFHTAVDGRRAGISVIWQEFSLAPKLTVTENIFLGRELTASGRLDRREMHRQAQAALDRMGSTISPHATVGSLSTSAQQIVEIARAISEQTRIIILDEPTASLSRAETDKLFSVLSDLRAKGMAILLVTHRLDEVFELADRVSVLRDGASVATLGIQGLTVDRLIELMVGETVTLERIAERVGGSDQPVLQTRELRVTAAAPPVSLAVYPGEIVGLTGLVGSGRTELARAIVGAEPAAGGGVFLAGREITRWPMRKRLRLGGIGFVPEDRKTQGVILPLSVARNLTLPNTDQVGPGPLVSPRREESLARRLFDAVHISARSTGQAASTLSGGNQQRMVIGKWLARQRVLYVFDEPTRGVDVSARSALYRLMVELAAGGSGVLMISSDLPEILAMSHRIYVLRNGAVSAELPGGQATEEQLLAAMFPDVPAESATDR